MQATDQKQAVMTIAQLLVRIDTAIVSMKESMPGGFEKKPYICTSTFLGHQSI
jgi:hypothetical protein